MRHNANNTMHGKIRINDCPCLKALLDHNTNQAHNSNTALAIEARVRELLLATAVMSIVDISNQLWMFRNADLE